MQILRKGQDPSMWWRWQHQEVKRMMGILPNQDRGEVAPTSSQCQRACREQTESQDGKNLGPEEQNKTQVEVNEVPC